MEQATYAFVGSVSDVRVDKKTGEKTIGFDVTDSFKGNPESDFSAVDANAGNDCALNVKEGESYLVYARWEWGVVRVSRCFGTKPLAETPLGANLGASNSMKDKMYDQLQKLCMGRKDTPCCLSSLKVMSSNHYLPEPDDGCPGGTIPDRLRCGGSMRWCLPEAEASHRYSSEPPAPAKK